MGITGAGGNMVDSAYTAFRNARDLLLDTYGDYDRAWELWKRKAMGR